MPPFVSPSPVKLFQAVRRLTLLRKLQDGRKDVRNSDILNWFHPGLHERVNAEGVTATDFHNIRLWQAVTLDNMNLLASLWLLFWHSNDPFDASLRDSWCLTDQAIQLVLEYQSDTAIAQRVCELMVDRQARL